MKIETEVLIVGGGATGAGIARDLSLRGVSTVLVEKKDFASGASGRNHGLLHSGGRYAVSDPVAARECITENRILKRIAPHCVEETEGLFVSLPEDGNDFRDRFLQACLAVEIPAVLLSRDEALHLEPDLHPDILGAIQVPDGAVDPFALVIGNVKDAEVHGARLLPHTIITSLILEGRTVRGATIKDRVTGEEGTIEASFVVNATGAWTNAFLSLVGLQIGMALSKGTLLVTNHRLSHRVINRCRPPSDGDIIVPNDTVSILGTTSVRVKTPEDFLPTTEEVDLLIRETSRMIPRIKDTRFIRAYAGIRPLFESEEANDDRQISRGFALIDHGQRDGLHGLITITGGKLVTYRLMAEKTSDLICEKIGRKIPCTTHLQPLPGAAGPQPFSERLKKINRLLSVEGGEIICDCELIQRTEVEDLLKGQSLRSLQDILHRTRLSKGTCQGGFCVFRLLGLLHEAGKVEGDSNLMLKQFLEERWRGLRPVLWGAALKEEELIESIYRGLFNL